MKNVFISEYDMPDSFREIASIEKTVLSTAYGSRGKAIEKIFTNKKTYERYNGACCDKQLTL